MIHRKTFYSNNIGVQADDQVEVKFKTNLSEEKESSSGNNSPTRNLNINTANDRKQSNLLYQENIDLLAQKQFSVKLKSLINGQEESSYEYFKTKQNLQKRT